MRSTWLRGMYASGGRAAPYHGLATAVGITAPLVAGTLTGHAADSVPAGLGAFYVAFAGPRGPYGARARSMLTAVVVVTVFTWFGGWLAGDPWLAAAVVPVVAAAGAALPWPGPTAALCTLIAAVRPPTSPVLLNGVLEMAGGLWVSVLLLAPWITNRLRPLRASFAEASRAVADAVDVLADTGSGTWDARRVEAYDAIRRARTTCALYRGLGREEYTRPRRFVAGLDRAMDEAVATRSLLAVLRREARPPPQWERESRAVVAALAGRLRGLAARIGTGRPASGPVGLDRFRRVSDDVRRVRVQRRGDVVGAALVLQVCRSVMRLSATVEDVDALAALGIRAGFDTPLPEVASPGHVIATFEGPGIRHAARVGVAIALSMVLANGFHLPYGYWLPITVMFCLRDSYGGTVERVTQRVGGATVGAIGAALALAIAPGPVTLVILVFVGAALGFALAPVNHLYWMTFATPLTMLLIDFTQRLAWLAAGWRIALTVAGGAIALVAARALWPAGTLRLVPGRLDRLLHTHAELVRTVATRFAGRPGAAVHERLADAAAAAVTLEDSLVRLGQEPAPPVDPLRRLREATTIARRLRDYLATLDALTEDRPVDAGPIVAILRRVADHLDAGTDPGDLDLGDLLRELDDHLSCLCRRRKAEIARGGDADTVTTLREALVQVAAARHAVRALAADADRLAHETHALIA